MSQIEVDIIAQAKAQASTGKRQLPNGRQIYNTTAQLQEATRRAFKPTHIPAKKEPVPVKKTQIINPRYKVPNEPEQTDPNLEEQLAEGETEEDRLNKHMEQARLRSHKLSDKKIPGAFAEVINQRKQVDVAKQPPKVSESRDTKVKGSKEPQSKEPKEPQPKEPKTQKKPAKKPIEDDINEADLDGLQLDDEVPKKPSKSKKTPKEQSQDNIEVEDISISDVDDDLEEAVAPKRDKRKTAK